MVALTYGIERSKATWQTVRPLAAERHLLYSKLR
jgi:hypothetical protein